MLEDQYIKLCVDIEKTSVKVVSVNAFFIDLWPPLSQHKYIFVKQTIEPIREKEHVDMSDTAKSQSSGPNAGEMADI